MMVISNKFQGNIISIHWRKFIWKCHLWNVDHLSLPQCLGSIFYQSKTGMSHTCLLVKGYRVKRFVCKVLVCKPTETMKLFWTTRAFRAWLSHFFRENRALNLVSVSYWSDLLLYMNVNSSRDFGSFIVSIHRGLYAKSLPHYYSSIVLIIDPLINLHAFYMIVKLTRWV